VFTAERTINYFLRFSSTEPFVEPFHLPSFLAARRSPFAQSSLDLVALAVLTLEASLGRLS